MMQSAQVKNTKEEDNDTSESRRIRLEQLEQKLWEKTFWVGINGTLTYTDMYVCYIAQH